MATVPPFMKAYPDGLPVVALPRDLPDPGVSGDGRAGRRPGAGAAARRRAARPRALPRRRRRADQAVARARLPLPRVRVGGRALPARGVREHARASPASRTACTGTTGAEHALVQVGPAAEGDVTTLVVTGVPWRTGWRYAERGWRHMYWDAGTLLSQLSAAAASAGFAPRLRSLFPDAAVRELVGADGVHEYPLALLSFGDGEPAIGPTGPARRVSCRRSSCRCAPPRSAPASATSSGRRGRNRSCRTRRHPTRSTRWCAGAARSG